MLRLRVKEVAEQKGITDAAKLSRHANVAYATAHRLWNGELGGEGDKGVGILILYRVARSLGVRLMELIVEDEARLALRFAAS